MLSNPTFNFVDSLSQEESSQSSSLTQYLINQISEAIFCVDSQSRVQYVNDSACTLVGCSRENLLQTLIDEIDLDFCSQAWSEYWELIQQQSSVNFQTRSSRDEQQQVLDVTINCFECSSQDYGCIVVRRIPTLPTKAISEPVAKLVVSNQDEISNKQTSFYPNCSQLKPIFEFIENNYNQPISLNDVAEAVGYSPAYLTNLVKRRTRRTIINWILERRMLEARSLLLNTQQSITNIAISIGFTDAYYFSRRFSQLHKISPKHWREQYQMQSA